METNADAHHSQRGALPIPLETSVGDLEQDPDSGEQYLLRVRMEAEASPRVVVAANREQLLLQARELAPRSPDHAAEGTATLPGCLRPAEPWLEQFARYFTQEQDNFGLMLSKISVPHGFSIPSSGQLREWKQLCYETGEDSAVTRKMHYAFATMDQAMAIRLIKWMTSWTAADKLRRAEGVWLWYLILRLDNLLDHGDTHCLRELCRKLKVIRANIGHNLGHSPSESLAIRSDEIAALNILIASVTRGYRQRDLEDD